MVNHRFELYRSYATINLPASSACNDIKSWRRARQREDDSGKQHRVGKIVDPLNLDCGTRFG
jgi:hypothetical protein